MGCGAVAAPDGFIDHFRISNYPDMNDAWRAEYLGYSSTRDVTAPAKTTGAPYPGTSGHSLIAGSGSPLVFKLLTPQSPPNPESSFLNITDNTYRSSQGRINVIDGNLINDGETVTITMEGRNSYGTQQYGRRQTVTYEFDKNASVLPGNIAVPITDGDNAITVCNALSAMITTYSGQSASQSSAIPPWVLLTNSFSDYGVAITHTVANPGFTVFGMYPGISSQELNFYTIAPPEQPRTLAYTLDTFRYKVPYYDDWYSDHEGWSAPGDMYPSNPAWSPWSGGWQLLGQRDRVASGYNAGNYPLGFVDAVAASSIASTGATITITDCGVPDFPFLKGMGIYPRDPVSATYEFTKTGGYTPPNIPVTINNGMSATDVAFALASTINATDQNLLFVYATYQGIATVNLVAKAPSDLTGSVSSNFGLNCDDMWGGARPGPASVMQLDCVLAGWSRLRFRYRTGRDIANWGPTAYSDLFVEVFNQVQRPLRLGLDVASNVPGVDGPNANLPGELHFTNAATFHVPGSINQSPGNEADLFLSPPIPPGFTKFVFGYQGLFTPYSDGITRITEVEIIPVAEANCFSMTDDFVGGGGIGGTNIVDTTKWIPTIDTGGSLEVLSDPTHHGVIRLTSGTDAEDGTKLWMPNFVVSPSLGSTLEARVRLVQTSGFAVVPNQSVFIGYSAEGATAGDTPNLGFFAQPNDSGDYWQFGDPNFTSTTASTILEKVRWGLNNQWVTLRFEMYQDCGTLVYMNGQLLQRLTNPAYTFEGFGPFIRVRKGTVQTALDVDYITVSNTRRYSNFDAVGWGTGDGEVTTLNAGRWKHT
jgi:hypothetical protein